MTDAMAIGTGTHSIKPPTTRVYMDYFGLVEAPFTITPDPEFLFSSGAFRQVLDKIHYAIDGRMGFVLLTGEVGTGKTTVCRTLLDRLGKTADTVYVINPSISGRELLACILDDLDEAVPPEATKKELIDRLNKRLIENGVKCPIVVIIDDAQTMPSETLEDLRLLSNLETDKHKLIQVILSGQPELSEILAGANLRQLKQRIAIHCHLAPLSAEETGAYIARRLFVAGNQGQVQFSRSATRLIHRRSSGIPRLINKICDFALTAGYVRDARSITSDHVRDALRELNAVHLPWTGKRARGLFFSWAAATVAALALLLFFALGTGSQPSSTRAPDDFMAHQKTETAAMSIAPDRPAATSVTTVMDPITGNALLITAPEDIVDVTAKLGTKTDKPGNPPTQDTAGPATYALQLCSYRSEKYARRGAALFEKKGIPAHWQMLNGGQWYRVIAGKFDTMAEANHYKKNHELDAAMVIEAPFTVKVLPRKPDLPNSNLPMMLSQIGYDSLMETDSAGDTKFYTGLFKSVADASVIAERINENGHLLAQVVTR